MLQHTGQVCKICDIKMREDDDVVYCPECGAPVHKACHAEKGVCPYEEAHREGFSWKPDISDFLEAGYEQAKESLEKEAQTQTENAEGVCELELRAFMNTVSPEAEYRFEKIKNMLDEGRCISLNIFFGLLNPYSQFFNGMVLIGSLLLLIYFVTEIPSAIMLYLMFLSPDTAQKTAQSFGLFEAIDFMSWLRIAMIILVSLFGDYMYIRWMIKKIKKIRLGFNNKISAEYLEALSVAGRKRWGLVGICFLIWAAMFGIIMLVLDYIGFASL